MDSIHGYYPQPLLDEYNDSFPVEQELTSNIFSKNSVQIYLDMERADMQN